jgi:cytoskeletal protein CcmA (bactofilin family)
MTDPAAEGYIGVEMRVRGQVEGEGSLVVEGSIEGPVAIEGALSLGTEGHLSGPVRATSLTVAGRLEGDVDTAESVVVSSGGLIIGDVRASRVAIDDGGSLDGAIEMDFDLPELESPANRKPARRRSKR